MAKINNGDHFMKSRYLELSIGLVLSVVGGFLLWDALDNRGKKLPWPLSALLPW